MTSRSLFSTVALIVATGLLVTSFPKTVSPTGRLRSSFWPSWCRSSGRKGSMPISPKEAPITITLQIYDASEVGAICELAPRIRDAVMETLHYYPIRMKRNRKMVFKRVRPSWSGRRTRRSAATTSPTSL